MTVDFDLPEVKDAIAKEADKISSAKIEEATAGLKAKQTELMDELKEMRRKFKDIDPEEVKALKAQKREADDKDADPVKLRERIQGEYEPKLTAAEQRAVDAENKLNSMVIDNQLTAALLESGVAKEFLRAVKADLGGSRKVEVSEGGVVVDGKPVGDFVKTWVTSEGKPFIAAGDHSGGGAGGGRGGGAADSKKLADMSAKEKAEFIRENGDEAYRKKVDNENLQKV